MVPNEKQRNFSKLTDRISEKKWIDYIALAKIGILANIDNIKGNKVSRVGFM